MLLRSCGRVQILATSRALLGAAGEATWGIKSLSVPDPQVHVDCRGDLEAKVLASEIRPAVSGSRPARGAVVHIIALERIRRSASVSRAGRHSLAIELAAALLGLVFLVMGLAFGGMWVYAVRHHEFALTGIDPMPARPAIPRFTIGNIIYLRVSPLLRLLLYGLVAVYYVFPTLPVPRSNDEPS